MKFAILGGGISGLTVGSLLRAAGHQIDIFEKDEIIGGLCRTADFDGFLLDEAGGHILYSKLPEALQFMVDAVGEDGYCQRERKTKIYYRDGIWVKYPFENGVGSLPPTDRFDCLMGYLDAYWKRQQPGAAPPGNFHDWVLYRMGEGFGKHFMFPYNEKIWKIDLKELSSSWVEGRVPEAPVEDIVRAAVGVETEGYTHQSHFRYPLKGGFQTITDRIGAPLEDVIHKGTAVENVKRKGEGWSVNGTDYDFVVNTMPLPEFLKTVEGVPSDVRKAADDLTVRGLASILIGLNHDRIPDYSWIYLPFEEQGAANRITYLSNYSPGNAPEGCSSIQAEVTFKGPSRVDDAFVQDLVSTYERIGLLEKSDVIRTGFKTVKYAYIVYDLDFQKKLDRSLGWVDDQGIYSTGRFARFDYYNSDQCVDSAQKLVKQILSDVERG
ncbi:MAG: FAD-dependent oxidoreductase [Planctomycetota bacterium]